MHPRLVPCSFCICSFIFIVFWLLWVFVAVHGVFCCRGFSRCGAEALAHTGFNSCGARALLPDSMWGLPGLGIRPVFPALADRLLTTGAPGKSCPISFKKVSLRKFPGSPVVQFRHSVVSDSLRPHESQYARPPCPSPTPTVYPNSCPLSQ